jgi:imidazolonepropionase-like amidohydrolase
MVVVRDGRIASVASRPTDWRPPAGARLLDLAGCSLTPGLIDTHVHLAFEGSDGAAIRAFAASASEDELLDATRRNAAAALRGGVTTVRDCGAPGTSALEIRRQIAAGETPGPRVVACGRPITTPTGHCHWMGLHASTADELRSAVRELARDGVDAIKVMVTGGMMTPGNDPYASQFAPEALAAAVEEAHELALPVAGHVLCAAGVRDALNAGIDTIEHCWTITGARQDYDPALGEAMARSGTFGSVTAHSALRALLAPGDHGELRRRLEPHRRLHAAGVRLVAHSDAGTPGTRFDEFPLTIEAFMWGIEVTMSEAVRAATQTAADALGLGADVGSVAPGHRADLVAFDGDLRSDPRALRRVRSVIQDGRVVVPETSEAAG